MSATAPSPSPGETPSGSTIRSGLSWATIAHVSSQVLWYGSLFLLVGLVDPDEFGTVTLGLSLVLTASVVMEAGGTGSIIASRNVTAGGVRRTIVVNVALALVLTVAMALLAGPLVDAFAPGGNADAVRALSLCFLFIGVGIAPLAVMQKALLFRRVALIRVAATATGAVVGIVAGVLGAGIWALVARQLVFQGLLGAIAWWGARGVMPRREQTEEAADQTRDARWFALLALGGVLALSADNFIVGSQTSATELGLYSLAFTLGFAPLTQISWVVGGVLFAVAAASDLQAVARRTVVATRFTALALLPTIVPAVVLAPVLIPGILGERWEPSVFAFQLLWAAGILHALVNTIGESLGAIGQIRWRATATAVAAAVTLVAVYVGTAADGIDGAALGHLLLLAPLVLAFATSGMRRVGSSPGALWTAVRGVLAACAVQVAVVVAVRAVLDGAGDDVAGLAAGAAGLAVAALVIARERPLKLVRAARA